MTRNQLVSPSRVRREVTTGAAGFVAGTEDFEGVLATVGREGTGSFIERARSEQRIDEAGERTLEQVADLTGSAVTGRVGTGCLSGVLGVGCLDAGDLSGGG